jgi:glutaredoxin
VLLDGLRSPESSVKSLPALAAMVAMLAVTLHRCSTPWKFGPCWRVQKALDELGVEYRTVKGPLRPARRSELRQLSGQSLYPVIEFEDGSFYREESRDMAQTIRAGKLDEKRGGTSA